MTDDLGQRGRADVDEIGPIDYIVAESPGAR
jgi:hypothetical protein